MPVTPTYPGVYIEEIPSGVRTITGVATSITAFVGRALRGPTDTPVTIFSFAEFERVFGGLWADSSLGYAVRDFYLNGGREAIVVRLFNPADAKTFKLSVGPVKLQAKSQGRWGTKLSATVQLDASQTVADKMGLAKSDLFSLTVRDTSPNGVTEKHINLTFKESPRRVDRVLDAESNLVTWDPDTPVDPNNPPANIVEAPSNEAEKLVQAEASLADATKKLQEGKSANPPLSAAAIKKLEDAVADAQKALNAINVTDGISLTKKDNFTPVDAQLNKKGLYALEKADLFNLLCIPPYRLDEALDTEVALVTDAAAYCKTRRAMLIVDPPKNWVTQKIAADDFGDSNQDHVGTRGSHAALFFPRLKQPNPLRENQIEEFAPCGAVAGVFARTDAERGVWKAPAGLDAALVGVAQLSVPLTDDENGKLNQLGINCLRAMPAAGRVVWGSRTLEGDDRLASEWKYIPVRRLALYLEESLYRGTQWVVFEPNDEPLWAQIRLNVGAFMHNLFVQGAFQGKTPRDAYYVKCDRETTTQTHVNSGIVNIVVGFAPLKPAEFVVIKIQQMAGQIEV
jgi:Bacteriophage tail sheath protein